jgi:hypothetical protein
MDQALPARTPRRAPQVALLDLEREVIDVLHLPAIGMAPRFQYVSCGSNVAFDNLRVIENKLRAAMTNPLLRGLVDLTVVSLI